MARQALFNFIPESQLNKVEEHEFRVSITRSGGLYFSREVMEVYDLDKKWFKFYADKEKKAIAWKMVDQEKMENLSEYKRLGLINKGAGQISINKLLKAVGITELRGSISDIPVRPYEGTLLDGKVSYIIVNEKDAKERTYSTAGKKGDQGGESSGNGSHGESGAPTGGQESRGTVQETIPVAG